MELGKVQLAKVAVGDWRRNWEFKEPRVPGPRCRLPAPDPDCQRSYEFSKVVTSPNSLPWLLVSSLITVSKLVICVPISVAYK